MELNVQVMPCCISIIWFYSKCIWPITINIQIIFILVCNFEDHRFLVFLWGLNPNGTSCNTILVLNISCVCVRKHLPRSIARHLRVLLYTRLKDVQYFNVLIASMSLWKYSASLVLILLWTEKKLFFVHFFFRKKKKIEIHLKSPSVPVFLRHIYNDTLCSFKMLPYIPM